MVVSDPLPAGLALTRGITLSSLSTAGEVVYLSLVPGSVPDARRLTIINKTKASAPVLITVADGGFDPVPVAADADDVLNLTFTLANGARIAYTVKVPKRRAPGVVRTDPAKGRIDVALNVSVAIVFTEPVDEATVNTNTVRLIRDGSVVAGTVTMTNSFTAVFTPTFSLNQGTGYALTVSPDVRDLDGESIGSSFTTSFTTGGNIASNCPGFAIPNACPPFPTGGPYTVTGQILERTETGTRLVPDAFAYAWVQTAVGGYARGRLPVSSQGFYEATLIPTSTVVIEAGGPGMTQPCVARVDVTNASVSGVDAELESAENPRPDRHTASPVVKGTVYEETPTGRQPVAGASVWFDSADDLWIANTTTDSNGRYAMCNLIALWQGFRPGISVAKDGYSITDTRFTLQPGVNEIDVVLRR